MAPSWSGQPGTAGGHSGREEPWRRSSSCACRETFEDGVRREIAEETGVIVDVGPLTGVYKNIVRGVVVLVYRCRPVSGHPVPTAESQRVEWVAVEEVERRMAPAYAVRVLDALAPGPSSRAHDGRVVIEP